MEKEKQIIIIFTLVDGCTKEYFNNFFDEFNCKLEYWCFDKSDEFIIYFIEDSNKHKIINIINDLNNKEAWVFLHKSGKNKSRQFCLLQKILSGESKYYCERCTKNTDDWGDHHNNDGKHYSIILEASELFKNGNVSKMNTKLSEIEKLL